MSTSQEAAIVEKLKTLSPGQLAELEDFVDFLAAKSRRNAALDRLLGIAPALEAVGAMEPSEEAIAAEVAAARAERRTAHAAGSSDADLA